MRTRLLTVISLLVRRFTFVSSFSLWRKSWNPIQRETTRINGRRVFRRSQWIMHTKHSHWLCGFSRSITTIHCIVYLSQRSLVINHIPVWFQSI
jgi:hypothetical protein